MRLEYEVTKAQYLELLATQVARKNRMLPNLLFLALAVWLCISRADATLWVRFGPVLMALILMGMSLYKKGHGLRFAEEAYRRLLKQGAVKEEFIGPHTLEIRDGMLLRSYGEYCDKVPCNRITELRRFENSSVLVAESAMFELIPNEFLDRDNNRCRLAQQIGIR